MGKKIILCFSFVFHVYELEYVEQEGPQKGGDANAHQPSNGVLLVVLDGFDQLLHLGVVVDLFQLVHVGPEDAHHDQDRAREGQEIRYDT